MQQEAPMMLTNMHGAFTSRMEPDISVIKCHDIETRP